ncbi:hypothetical protein PLESTB_000684500 [Pleodorina starrii]|uniref:Protein kinase domain-containing protein n=1 Tax=Pleodorina starrii TaxID=330485 RepID=A0A9W6BJG9_9CHLO|nr:hypothetical protein PLESTB_000684500 [Pleodorina starrii]GLC65187.1 hypothetical protein PLESTF_000261500 [Pleodorina starrii]
MCHLRKRVSDRHGGEALAPFSIGLLLLLIFQPLLLLGASVASWEPSAFLQAPGCQSWSTASGLGIASGVTSCVVSRNTTLQRGQPEQLPIITWIQGQGAACCALNGGEGGGGCQDGALQSPPQVFIPPPEPSSGYWTPVAPAGGSDVNSPTVMQLPQPVPGLADLPTLNLASLSGIFVVPANGSLALCNLRLEGAILPSTYPLPAASFLALSAFNLTAALDRRAPGQPPPLQLANLVIVTPSCPVLSLYQAFACGLSPSPNFTVTPTFLVVHRFTTSTAYIQNVTLTCSTTAAATSPSTTTLPLPSCLAVKAASGGELLGAITTMGSMVEIAKTESGLVPLVAYFFLEGDISLLETSATQQLYPQVTVSTATFVLAGRPDGTTVLDLHGTADLITVSAGASVELRHLVLRNAPLGPPTEALMAFLRMFLWTFSFRRQIYGFTRQTTLTVTNVTLEVPREELALWFHDILGPDKVPEGLQADLCVCNATRVMHAEKAEVEFAQVPDRGPSMLWKTGSSLTSAYTIRNVLLTRDDKAPWCSSNSGAPLPVTGSLMAPLVSSPPAGNGSSSSATQQSAAGCSGRICSVMSRPSLCLLVPEGVCGLAVNLARADTLGSGTPGSINTPIVSSGPVDSWTLEPDLLRKDVIYLGVARYLGLGPSDDGWLWSPGMITRPSTLMGSFIASVALDVALLPGAIVLPNTTSGIFNASLTIRAIILVNLPAAGEYSVSVPSLPNARPPQPPIPPTPPPWPAAEFAMAPQSLPSRRLMQQLGGPWRESSGISGIGGTKRMRLHAAGGRVLQQELGNGASTNPTDTLTQGLDPAMTNFTSCLWTVNFNRREASARQKLLASPSSNGSLGSTIDPRRPMGLPYVFLDSVVAVIPQPELDLLVWVWATNSTDAATAPGLADQLVQMLAASRLSLESAATVSRAAVENTTVTRLVFDQLWWCALEGSNVTFTSQLPQQLVGNVSLSRLQLTLTVDFAQPSATLDPPPPPPPPLLSPPDPPPSASPPKQPVPPSSPAQLSPSPLHHPLSSSDPSAGHTEAINPEAVAGRGGQPRTKTSNFVKVVCAAVAATVAVTVALPLAILFTWRRKRCQGSKSSEKQTPLAGGSKSDDVPGGEAASLAHSRQSMDAQQLEVTIPSSTHADLSSHGALLALHNVMHTLTLRAAAGAPHTATEVDSLKACGAGDVETTPAPSPEAVEGLAHLVAGAGAGAADLPRMGSAAELAPAAGLLAGAGSAGSGSSQQQGDPVLTITGELGRGAQGVVYRGVWRGLDVAVKSRLLQCGLLGGGGPQGLVAAAADTPSQDLALPHRAIQEAAISTSVSHPNVVATYTYTLERLEDAPPRLNAAIMRADDKPAVQGTNTGSASSSSSSSSSQADGSVPKSAADASGRGELEVWKLTLVQELCDGNSLRCCLEQGTLTGCQVVETQSSGHFGISRRVGAGPAASAPGGCGPQSSAVSSGPAALQSPAAGPLMQQQQLDPRITLMVALQAARGLAHLHSSGIVHADVSSANILLKRLPSRSGGDGHSSGANGCGAAADPYSYGYVAKVCDFGLSGKLDDTRAALHLSGPARAVSAYTAPELVRHGRASPAGDVYAFAVVLWELALGCPLPALLARPEGARLQSWLAQQSRMDPRTVEPLPPSLLMWPADGVPPGLLGLVGECLRGDPATRPSARQLYERLHTLLAGEPPLQQQQQPPSLQPPQQQQQCQALQEGSISNYPGPGTSCLSLDSSTVTWM